jgi:hypothetical protein
MPKSSQRSQAHSISTDRIQRNEERAEPDTSLGYLPLGAFLPLPVKCRSRFKVGLADFSTKYP